MNKKHEMLFPERYARCRKFYKKAVNIYKQKSIKDNQFEIRNFLTKQVKVWHYMFVDDDMSSKITLSNSNLTLQVILLN